MAKVNTADLVAILKTMPTVEAINTLGDKIVNDLKAEDKKESKLFGEKLQLLVYGCIPREYGCDIADKSAVVRLRVTILPQNAGFLVPDLHCK